MTSSNGNNSDRLERIEAIIESNSPAVQAMMEQQATDRLKPEEEKIEHEQRMARLEDLMVALASIEQGQNRMLANIDEAQPTIKEHNSATIGFEADRPLLRKASWLLRNQNDVMLLADRGFANQALLTWLKSTNWHYSIRVPRDTSVWGVHRWCSVSVSQLKAVRGKAKMYHQVRLWESGTLVVNLALAYPQNSAEPWAVITDEIPSLQTFGQYGLRFPVEELFLDSKSGVFGLADSRLRFPQKLSRLYLVND